MPAPERNPTDHLDVDAGQGGIGTERRLQRRHDRLENLLYKQECWRQTLPKRKEIKTDRWGGKMCTFSASEVETWLICCGSTGCVVEAVGAALPTRLTPAMHRPNSLLPTTQLQRGLLSEGLNRVLLRKRHSAADPWTCPPRGGPLRRVECLHRNHKREVRKASSKKRQSRVLRRKKRVGGGHHKMRGCAHQRAHVQRREGADE